MTTTKDVAAHVPITDPIMSLIQRAATDPAFDVAKLESLLKVRERWEAEEARKAFVQAMTEFKANPPQVFKSHRVHFDTQKGSTDYKHAKLSDVSSIIGEALSKHGLSHRWNVDQSKDGKIRVTAIITHVQGHSESVTMECAADLTGNKNGIQAIGSAVSYLQRYSLFAASGVAAKDQDDDDGRAAGVRKPIADPEDGWVNPNEPVKGVDTFRVTGPLAFKSKSGFSIKSPTAEYRATEETAKTAKANFKDGDTAVLAWDTRDGVKWVAELDRKAKEAF